MGSGRGVISQWREGGGNGGEAAAAGAETMLGIGIEGGKVRAEACGEDLHQEVVPEAGDGNGASVLRERAVLVRLWDGGEERIPEGSWFGGG